MKYVRPSPNEEIVPASVTALKQYFGDKLYDAVIPRNVRLAEAPSYGMPALVYDKQSRGALAYLALAG